MQPIRPQPIYHSSINAGLQRYTIKDIYVSLNGNTNILIYDEIIKKYSAYSISKERISGIPTIQQIIDFTPVSKEVGMHLFTNFYFDNDNYSA